MHAFCCLLFSLIAIPVAAGPLSGRVADATGRPLPRALVRVLDSSGKAVADTLTQADGSFTQHNLYGRQMYLGSYGVSFMDKAYRYYASVQDTRFALGPEELLSIKTAYFEFLPWVTWRGTIDPSQLGRYNVRNFFSQPDAVAARRSVAQLVAIGGRFMRSGAGAPDRWTEARMRSLRINTASARPHVPFTGPTTCSSIARRRETVPSKRS